MTDDWQAMFIPVYLTIIIVLFSHQTIGVEKVIGDDVRDSGWGLFLSVSQGNDEYPSYDIGHWTRQLHLQQCAFVEIGEEFCAVRISPSIFYIILISNHVYLFLLINIDFTIFDKMRFLIFTFHISPNSHVLPSFTLRYLYICSTNIL